jgi:hypothetical protein
MRESSSLDNDLVSCTKRKRPRTSMAMCKRSSGMGRESSTLLTSGASLGRDDCGTLNNPSSSSNDPNSMVPKATMLGRTRRRHRQASSENKRPTTRERGRGNGRDHLRKGDDRAARERCCDIGLCRRRSQRGHLHHSDLTLQSCAATLLRCLVRASSARVTSGHSSGTWIQERRERRRESRRARDVQRELEDPTPRRP